jgi:esterase/lipase superfamily enzyme
MSARHWLLENSDLGRRVHMWTFGEMGRPLVVFPSNAGVAHEWRHGGMIDALGPLLAAGRVKIYCPETNVSKSFSGSGSVDHRMAQHRAYERFVVNTLVPFIREDCKMPRVRMVAAGCSVGALYSSIFTLKYPEVFKQALCLSGKYRTSSFFDGESNEDLYLSDPFAFLPNLHGNGLDRVRRHAHLTLVVGRAPNEGGCLPETVHFGSLLEQKGIPHHVALWGTDASHSYPWWQKQALHYLSQMF